MAKAMALIESDRTWDFSWMRTPASLLIFIPKPNEKLTLKPLADKVIRDFTL